jgi:phenylpyruvate tautomerase PptA (4-oxalocrotonate tautomerase family)
MPIVDIQWVVSDGKLPDGLTGRLADSLGDIFGAEPGRVWVRLSALPADCYAENGISPGQMPMPAFVRITHADPLPRESLASQAHAVAVAVGLCLARPSELVHVEFAPPGRGRMAFGGKLLD